MRQWYALKFAQQIEDLAWQPTQYFQLDPTNPFYPARCKSALSFLIQFPLSCSVQLLPIIKIVFSYLSLFN